MPYRNVEDRKAWAKRYYASHKKEATEYRRRWRVENREHYLELQRKYQKKLRDARRKPKVIPDYSEGKLCLRCNEKKPIEDFPLVKGKYLYHLCKKCKREKWKEYAAKGDYYKKHREYELKLKESGRAREYALRYYHNNKEKIKARIIAKRGYAKKERRKAQPKELLETRWYFKKSRLLANSILEPEDIPEELKQAYKMYLQLKKEKRNVRTKSI